MLRLLRREAKKSIFHAPTPKRRLKRLRQRLLPLPRIRNPRERLPSLQRAVRVNLEVPLAQWTVPENPSLPRKAAVPAPRARNSLLLEETRKRIRRSPSRRMRRSKRSTTQVLRVSSISKISNTTVTTFLLSMNTMTLARSASMSVGSTTLEISKRHQELRHSRLMRMENSKSLSRTSLLA